MYSEDAWSIQERVRHSVATRISEARHWSTANGFFASNRSTVCVRIYSVNDECSRCALLPKEGRTWNVSLEPTPMAVAAVRNDEIFSICMNGL